MHINIQYQKYKIFRYIIYTIIKFFFSFIDRYVSEKNFTV